MSLFHLLLWQFLWQYRFSILRNAGEFVFFGRTSIVMLCIKYHNMIKCFVRPLSVRVSSRFMRDDKMAAELNLIRDTLDRNHQPTVKEWNELRDKVLCGMKSKYVTYNIDTYIVGTCLPAHLDAGKSYMNYLKESGIKPQASTLINLLKLYYKASKVGIKISTNDQQDIIDMLVIPIMNDRTDIY